jgi:hypothetical protein
MKLISIWLEERKSTSVQALEMANVEWLLEVLLQLGPKAIMNCNQSVSVYQVTRLSWK